MNDHDLAAHLAESAGRLLLEVRGGGLLEGKALGAAGDAVAQQFLARALAAQRPDDGMLSEEAADTDARLSKQRVWIIDPLDGTREYSEGRNDWAVHVALAVDGVATIGAVAQPGLGVTYRSDTARLADCEGKFRIVVSRTRAPVIAERVADALQAELVPMGSAGAKAMAVVRGEAHAYLHAGGQHEWDSAAPVAVASAAGLTAVRLDGSALRYNQPSPHLPDLLIAQPGQAERVLAAIRLAANQVD